MRKVVLLLIAALTLGIYSVEAKKNDEGLTKPYYAEGAGSTTGASHQVRVTITSKKKDITEDDLGKCAVHATLFQDIDDSTNSAYGSTAVKKAIMGSPSAEAQYIDFFEPFFRNGDYNRYVQLVKDNKVVKADGKYKISAVVKVNVNQLKNDLVKQGMVKNLGTGW